LVELLHKRATDIPDQEHILLLAVMLDAGPYSEQAESRLRARHAVLEGLSESGFMPGDGEHIGFVTAAWPPSEEGLEGVRPKERALLLPWEECEAMDHPARVYPRNTRCVVIAWLPAASFDSFPLSRFANVIYQLAGRHSQQDRHQVDWTGEFDGPAKHDSRGARTYAENERAGFTQGGFNYLTRCHRFGRNSAFRTNSPRRRDGAWFGSGTEDCAGVS
jgi:hypothetical protein